RQDTPIDHRERQQGNPWKLECLQNVAFARQQVSEDRTDEGLDCRFIDRRQRFCHLDTGQCVEALGNLGVLPAIERMQPIEQTEVDVVRRGVDDLQDCCSSLANLSTWAGVQIPQPNTRPNRLYSPACGVNEGPRFAPSIKASATTCEPLFRAI